jgi:hypothetical protein
VELRVVADERAKHIAVGKNKLDKNTDLRFGLFQVF